MDFNYSLHCFARDGIRLLESMDSSARHLETAPGDGDATAGMQSCVGRIRQAALSSGASPQDCYAFLVERLYRKYIKGETGFMSLLVVCLLRDFERRKHPELPTAPAARIARPKPRRGIAVTAAVAVYPPPPPPHLNDMAVAQGRNRVGL